MRELRTFRRRCSLAFALGVALISPAQAAQGRLDGREIATAALAPMWRVLNLGRDISRFIVAEVKPVIDSGAAVSADSTLRIPGRGGGYFVQWYDADGDKALSRGDGLNLQFSDCAPGREPDWDGVVRTPDLSLAPSSLSMPYFYADLRFGASGASQNERERMVGTLAITWSTPPTGEALNIYQGASGFSFDTGSGGAFLRRIRIVFSCPPRGESETRMEGEIYDRRFGHLTLVAVQPFKGACDGAPGSPTTGESTVVRELGGSIKVRVTGPGMATLEVDDNGDGDIDQRLDTNWAALTGQGQH